MTASVGLVVNSYERTYRDVLRPGFFESLVASNERPFTEVVALINNVDDPSDARERAQALVDAASITSYAFVSEHLPRALADSGLGWRSLKVRPYLLDYGLVMPHVVRTPWLLGWDAETQLVEPVNWVDPAIALMEADPRVFHAAVAWAPPPGVPGYEIETVEWSGDFALNWGFSDQLFLLRRDRLLGRVFRSFAPAALVRHAPHPYTFEYRVEARQRALGLYRATLTTATYLTNHLGEGVIERTGRSLGDRVRIRALRSAEYHVLDRLPRRLGARYRKS